MIEYTPNLADGRTSRTTASTHTMAADHLAADRDGQASLSIAPARRRRLLITSGLILGALSAGPRVKSARGGARVPRREKTARRCTASGRQRSATRVSSSRGFGLLHGGCRVPFRLAPAGPRTEVAQRNVPRRPAVCAQKVHIAACSALAPLLPPYKQLSLLVRRPDLVASTRPCAAAEVAGRARTGAQAARVCCCALAPHATLASRPSLPRSPQTSFTPPQRPATKHAHRQ